MWRTVKSVGAVQSAKQVVAKDDLKAAILQAGESFKNEHGETQFDNTYRYVTASV